MPIAKRKTRKTKMPSQVKNVKPQAEPTKIELKRAYQLVTKDLFTKLVQASDQARITIGSLGSLGSLTKTERKVQSGITPRGMKKPAKPKLNTYVYYRLLFKPSRKLKAELNKALTKKYK